MKKLMTFFSCRRQQNC